ncbi:MAG: hypothetical protein CMI17_05190 [Opitutaceae bacterium]|nr:hypothetical protein [Opitutaceae bacterium]
MKTFLSSECLAVSTALALIAIPWMSGQQESEPGGYLFFGTSVSAEAGESHFPIVSVDKKNIFVDAGIDVKKVSLRAPCHVRAELMLSESFADVLEMKFTTTSMTNLQRSAQAVSDMQFSAVQSEIAVSMLSSQLEGDPLSVDASPADMAIQSQIEDVQQNNSDFQSSMQDSLDMGNFEAEELADTVHVKGTIIPKTDMPGAYCVIVVGYDIHNLETGEMEGRGRFARAKYIGDLLAEDIVELRVRVSTGEFDKETAEFQMHLFTGDGEQVAMSNSRGLKPLTPQEVATFRELSAKTSLSNNG